MVKKRDTAKLDRVREAAVEVISEHGILNSSVASIAHRAGVSVGYLYRHYPGKMDLIDDLLEEALAAITDRIYLLCEQTNDIREVVRGVVTFILQRAVVYPPRQKFMIMLLNDFSVAVHPEIRGRIRRIGSALIEMGRKNNAVRDDISIEDLYLALIGIPMQYLAVYYKFAFAEGVENRVVEVEKVVAISLDLIRPSVVHGGMVRNTA